MIDDEQRWAEAEQILQGTPDEQVQERIAQRRRRVLAIGVGALVGFTALAAVAGWVLAARDHDAPHASPSVPLGVEIVGFVVIVLGLLIGALGLIGMRRDGNWRWRTPLSPLSRAQKRDLYHQITGKAPVDPARLPLTRDLARRVTQQGSVLVLFGGLVVTQLGSAILTPEAWRFELLAGLVLVLGLAAALTQREIRRASRFLEQH